MNRALSISDLIEMLSEIRKMHQLNLELLENLSVTYSYMDENKIAFPNEGKFRSLLNRSKALLEEMYSVQTPTLLYKQKLSDESYHDDDDRRKVTRT
jgi:hypothetical protein